MANYSDLPPGWEQQVLVGIGAPDTHSNQVLLNIWASFEKPHSGPDEYTNNPFNTTLQTPTSTSPCPTCNGNYPVQAYPSWAEGLKATIATLQNGYYQNILNILRQGNGSFTDFRTAVNSDKWGTKIGDVTDFSLYAPSASDTGQPPFTGGIGDFATWVKNNVGAAAGDVGSTVGNAAGSTGTALNNLNNIGYDTALNWLGLPSPSDIGSGLRKWGLLIAFAAVIILLVLELFRGGDGNGT